MSTVVSVITAIQIKLFNFLYSFLANWLTDWENHRTQQSYINNLTIKLFLFRFVNSYLSLYYIAFAKDKSLFLDPCTAEEIYNLTN